MIDKSLRISLVEDNPADARLIQEAISEITDQHIDLQIHTSLSESLAHFEASPINPDILIADLSLPDSKGLDTFHQIHRIVPQIPIVILTGLNDQTLAHQAVKEGAQDFVIKQAMSGEALARIINHAIERNRLLIECKLTEEALRKSREHLANAQRIAQLGSWIWNVKTGAVEWTDQVYEIFGLDPGEFEPQIDSVMSRFHPDDQNQNQILIQDAIENQAAITFSSRIVMPDNSIRNVISTSEPEFDEAGDLIRIIGTLQDVTDRTLAEQALKESESRYRSVYNTAPLAFVVWDTDTCIKEWNQYAEKLFGWTREEVVGKSFFDFIIPENAIVTVESVVNEVLQGNIQKHVINENITKDGEIIICEWNNAILENADGDISGAISLGLDITERKLAEEEVKANVTFLDTIMEESPFAMWISDARGTVIRTNETLRKTINLTDEQIIGAYNVLDDDNLRQQGVMAQVQAVFDQHQPTRFRMPWAGAQTGDAVFKDARSLWIDVAMFPIENPKGELTNVVCQWVDISSQVEATQALEQLNLELEQRVADRTAELESFAYSVSHDLKAPLRGIHGYSKLLLKNYAEQLDEEGKFFINNVFEAAENMRQLIDDLLAYSRMERREILQREIDLQEIITSVLSEFRAQIDSQGVDVQIELPCEKLFADVESLAQVIRNLIDNALKFSSDRTKPRIEINGKMTATACQLWVSDNGIGFDARYQDKIFEMFQRLHRADEYPGTGVGLAIVQKAMQRMGGRVWAESKPGQGATFYLEFPRSTI